MAMSSDSHLLSLKVVRLSQPGDALHNSLYKDLDPSIPAGKAMDSLAVEGMTSSIASESDISIAGLGSFQTLSQPFGNIYLGETFSSCLCVTNESSIQVLNLSFKAELQTSTQRLTLADTLASSSSLSSTASSERVGAGGMLGSYTSLQGSSAAGTQGGRKSLANSLLPSQSVEFIINHDIKELGIHILVCSVHYTPAPAVGSVPTGHDRERKFFRKFYKFQVLNPLSVKTKVNTLADGRIFLEAQVQNVSSTSMYLERMNFEPNEPFLLVNLNQFPCAADAKGVDLNEDKEPHANAVDSQDLMSTAIPPIV
ncbi:hypothetical protein BASA62_009809 [Batrachochytrium salamandrivorans]|nr:hypothetical protein BASA62_009809 [Batrachochytrium salamandrivorans]